MDNPAENNGSSLYSAYAEWKGWDTPFVCPPDLAGYFAGELRGRRLRDASVLEIGFGNGEFLGYARDQGAVISGCEITPQSIEAAERAGIPLLPADFETIAEDYRAAYDLVAAFDVFEHLEPPVIIAKLAAISIMLKPGGWLILRFPNGQSPYGLVPQNGDATHIVALSKAKIDQYAHGTGLRTIAYSGVARTHGGGLAKKVVRAIRYAVRDVHKALIRFAYATDAELDPVVVHILEKT
jgi:hypothetical protein